MLHINFNAKLSHVPYIDTFHANHVIQLVPWIEIRRRDPGFVETMKLDYFILSLIRTVRLQNCFMLSVNSAGTLIMYKPQRFV